MGERGDVVENDAAKFLYEVGQLKRVKRSGWWIAGVKDPESVAEHTFRTAVIAYLLAHLEGADTGKIVLMALFHDLPEARTNDAHRIVRRYADWKDVDKKAVREQSKRLPDKVANEVVSFFEEFEKEVSSEAKLARDADLLECLIQAREYEASGCYDVADWIRNAQAALTTESAKRIAAECLKTEPKEWWQGLKALEGRRGIHGD
jgi:5'-deoxynucleotidase YfbR-like HD superfamily hydrolase